MKMLRLKCVFHCSSTLKLQANTGKDSALRVHALSGTGYPQLLGDKPLLESLKLEGILVHLQEQRLVWCTASLQRPTTFLAKYENRSFPTLWHFRLDLVQSCIHLV